MDHDRETIIFLVKFLPAPAFDGGALRNKAWLKFFLKKYNVILIGFFNKRYHNSMVSVLNHPNLCIYGYNFKKNIYTIILLLIKLFLSGHSLILGRYRDKRIQKKVCDIIKTQKISFIFCSELATMQNIGANSEKNVPIYFDDHNVEFSLLDRMIKYTSWPKKFFLKMDKNKVKRYEMTSLKKAYYNFCVSDIDKKAFLKLSGINENKIRVVKNIFLTNNKQKDKNIGKYPIIVFLGNLNWPPNKYGLIRFIKNVFPEIIANVNNVHLYILGSNAPKELKKYAQHLPIKFFFDISEEVKEALLEKCCLGIVPLYFSSGSRIKILELWSHKIAVVSTIIGSEGLELSAGNHIVSSDNNFADKVIEVLSDKNRLIEDGLYNYETFINNYSFEVVYENSLYNSFSAK